MEWIAWIAAGICFIIAFAGLFYPVIPSVLFIIGGFLLYGLIDSFSSMGWLFWTIQVLFTILLFSADTAANVFSVKRFGGTSAGGWGSTIGLIAGPFVIPVAGILIGPFLGAVIAELLVTRAGVKQAFRSGVGSLVGFLTSVVVKAAVMIVMIAVFIFFII
ncbi:hypothetical protein NCCP2716_05740 [Sporosarcina sp. NCCP-2716]|uniref:DUF456 domain-containing protein n=1 Tax=Sporosarcina sp. NCCP-2716 TaxID=2943679 RepID=UPI00203BEE3E|nr:DUF456 family protein [Sporosarcina sp. NCCP-2716]GKV68076.1 hypothetical protein NCCP2716_05740 [Sporosarcina sp. NCCP-2716]